MANIFAGFDNDITLNADQVNGTFANFVRLTEVLTTQTGAVVDLSDQDNYSLTVSGSPAPVITFAGTLFSEQLVMLDLPGTVGEFIGEVLQTETLAILGFEDSHATFIGYDTGGILYALDKSLNPIVVVINIDNQANSCYQNFLFDSIVEFQGKMLASDGSTLYLLEGDDDDGSPIDADIELPLLDFSESTLKRFSDCILGMTGGPMLITPIVNGKEGTPSTFPEAGTDAKNVRAKLPHGLKGRYWSIRLNNIDGAPFTVSTIELPGEVLAKDIME